MSPADQPTADLSPDAQPPVCVAESLAVGYPGGRRLGRSRPPTVVLDGLDLTLRAGEVTCLLGANGGGKSTLLRTLAGMQPPLEGSVRLGGDEIGSLPADERARRVAVVLTDPVDAGLMTVSDLVTLGRHPHTGWAGRLGPGDRQAVDWALRVTGAAPLATRSVAELSDGERQRALVARALAQEPTLLALDEPVAYLDLARRVELTEVLRHLTRECGLAVLLTTHDLELALRDADRLWVIDRDGRIVVGGPEDLVLAGAIEAAFARDAVRFDPDRGVFVPDRMPVARVRVRGEGPAALWAARALEREGIATVASGPSDLSVVVGSAPDGTPRWHLHVPDQPAISCATVADLTTRARALVPAAPWGVSHPASS